MPQYDTDSNVSWYRMQISNWKCINTRSNIWYGENVKVNLRLPAAPMVYHFLGVNLVLSTKATLNSRTTRTTAYSSIDTKLNCHYSHQPYATLKLDVLRYKWSSGRFIHLVFFLFFSSAVCEKDYCDIWCRFILFVSQICRWTTILGLQMRRDAIKINLSQRRKCIYLFLWFMTKWWHPWNWLTTKSSKSPRKYIRECEMPLMY